MINIVCIVIFTGEAQVYWHGLGTEMSGIEPNVIWGRATSLLKSLFSPTCSFIIFIILTRCYFSFYLDVTGSLQNERERKCCRPHTENKEH